MSDTELHTGDRVSHADGDGSTGIVKDFPYYPFATVEWDSTGRESDENLYLLVPVDESKA